MCTLLSFSYILCNRCDQHTNRELGRLAMGVNGRPGSSATVNEIPPSPSLYSAEK